MKYLKYFENKTITDILNKDIVLPKNWYVKFTNNDNIIKINNNDDTVFVTLQKSYHPEIEIDILIQDKKSKNDGNYGKLYFNEEFDFNKLLDYAKKFQELYTIPEHLLNNNIDDVWFDWLRRPEQEKLEDFYKYVDRLEELKIEYNWVFNANEFGL